MEMEMEIKDDLGLAVERLTAAAGALEQAAERFAGIELQAVSARETQLEEQLAEAQSTIASLRAEAGRTRRTTSVPSLVARHEAPVEPGALDAALRSLSLEQRIAVKSEMMRAGLL